MAISFFNRQNTTYRKRSKFANQVAGKKSGNPGRGKKTYSIKTKRSDGVSPN